MNFLHLYHFPFFPAPLRRKRDQMAFERLVERGAHQAGILLADGFDPVADHAGIAAAVAYAFVVEGVFGVGVVCFRDAGGKVGVGERLHVADDVAACPHDTRTAAAIGSEPLDREVDRYAAFKFHQHHIMVGLVVLAMVDTFAVRACLQVFEDHITI